MCRTRFHSRYALVKGFEAGGGPPAGPPEVKTPVLELVAVFFPREGLIASDRTRCAAVRRLLSPPRAVQERSANFEVSPYN